MQREIKFRWVGRNRKFDEIQIQNNLTVQKIIDGESLSFFHNSNRGKNGNCEFISEDLFTGIEDVAGVQLYEGDIIKIWNFYNVSGSSEDWFGTEPQNSFRVYEEYLEQIEAKIVFSQGGFVARTKKEDIPLQTVLYGLGREVVEHYLYDYGGPIDYMLESISEDISEEEYDELVSDLKKESSTDNEDPEFNGQNEFYDKLEQVINKITTQIEFVNTGYDNSESLK